MLKLGKYLKPNALTIILAIALLFVQANADLALPDYLSNIVNTGIQQGGVEQALPKAVSQRTMNQVKLLLPQEQARVILGVYDRISLPENPEPSQSTHPAENPTGRIAELLREYPKAAGGDLYVLKNISTQVQQELEPSMAKAMIVAAKLPLEAIQAMNQDQRNQVRETSTQQFAAMGPSMLTQAAAGAISAEYESLGADMGAIQRDYILQTGGIMLLLTLLSAASTIMVGFMSARVAAGFSRDLRLAVFDRVENFSLREFDTFSTASLITRTTNDIMQIQMVVIMLIRIVFYAPILGVGGIIRALGKSSSMWWIIALAVGALSILVAFAYLVAVPKFKIIQKLTDKLNLVSREGLSGMMVIRAFTRQHHEEARFDQANKDVTSTMLYVNRVMVLLMPIMMLIMNGLSVLIIWVGSHEIANSAMQVGDMMAFLQYSMQIVMSFLMLSMMFIMLPRAAVSADRVAEVITTKPSITDPEQPEYLLEDFNATLEFDQVSFRYQEAEEDILHDISFTAKPGQTTAFIGSTGCGKSTLVNLIPRFYDVTQGSIRLGGKDIRTLSQKELRRNIGYVPQKATLFSGTIADNLRYGREDTPDGDLEAAARTAQAEEFIQSREQGMESTLSQGGINLSGGQKQRLSIARALVKKPSVYIFDDSFSALDFKTDSKLRAALGSQTANSTVLIVTQRVSTIKHAEQIIVLDEGRIVGRGTHHQLMESCQTYREIATSQLTTEELA